LLRSIPDVVVRTVARAEPAAEIASARQGHATKVCAYAKHNKPATDMQSVRRRLAISDRCFALTTWGPGYAQHRSQDREVQKY
jgi:hypothetical protein